MKVSYIKCDCCDKKIVDKSYVSIHAKSDIPIKADFFTGDNFDLCFDCYNTFIKTFMMTGRKYR